MFIQVHEIEAQGGCRGGLVMESEVHGSSSLRVVFLNGLRRSLNGNRHGTNRTISMGWYLSACTWKPEAGAWSVCPSLEKEGKQLSPVRSKIESRIEWACGKSCSLCPMKTGMEGLWYKNSWVGVPGVSEQCVCLSVSVHVCVAFDR